MIFMQGDKKKQYSPVEKASRKLKSNLNFIFFISVKYISESPTISRGGYIFISFIV